MHLQSLLSRTLVSLQLSLGKLAVLLFIVIASLTVNYLYAAWTPPTAAFPNGDVDTPINIGANVQVKSGGTIGVDTLITNEIEVGVDGAADTGTMVADFNGNIGAEQYCDANGANCTSLSGFGSGGTVIEAIAANGYTIPSVPGLAAWPDFLICPAGTADQEVILPLNRVYYSGGNITSVKYLEADNSRWYRFNADGSKNVSNNVSGTCGAPASDVVSICDAGRCGWY